MIYNSLENEIIIDMLVNIIETYYYDEEEIIQPIITKLHNMNIL